MTMKTLALILILFVPIQPAQGNPLLVKAGQWTVSAIASYLFGKGIDSVWDTTTGKPNIRELDRKLQHLENQLAKQSQLQQQIRSLRQELADQKLTQESYAKTVLKHLNIITNKINENKKAIFKNQTNIQTLQENWLAFQKVTDLHDPFIEGLKENGAMAIPLGRGKYQSPYSSYTVSAKGCKRGEFFRCHVTKKIFFIP